jgi:hypothetical protein
VGAENFSFEVNRPRDVAVCPLTFVKCRGSECVELYLHPERTQIEEGMELAKLWAVISWVLIPWSFSSEY